MVRTSTTSPLRAGWRAVAAPAALAVAALAVVGLVGVVDPNQPGHYPTCPFLVLTGHFCPGCGSLRAIHALAHGRIGEAAGLNVLLVALVPLLVLEWGRWVAARSAGRRHARPAPGWALWALVVVICVFWVVRNLPFGAALAP